MLPSVTDCSPLIRLNSVVLPAPLGPMMARRSPAWTLRLTPSTARSPPNALETFERLSAATAWAISLAVFAGWKVAIVDGLLQELVGRVFPELRDVGVGVDHGVPQLPALLLDLPEVDVLDRVAVTVELDGPARGVGNLHLAERDQESVPVLDITADGLGRLVDPAPGRIADL